VAPSTDTCGIEVETPFYENATGQVADERAASGVALRARSPLCWDHPLAARVSTYSRVGEGLWTTWEQMVEQFAAHHNICTAKSAAQRCPVQECVILV